MSDLWLSSLASVYYSSCGICSLILSARTIMMKLGGIDTNVARNVHSFSCQLCTCPFAVLCFGTSDVMMIDCYFSLIWIARLELPSYMSFKLFRLFLYHSMSLEFPCSSPAELPSERMISKSIPNWKTLRSRLNPVITQRRGKSMIRRLRSLSKSMLHTPS
eukprot:04712_4